MILLSAGSTAGARAVRFAGQPRALGGQHRYGPRPATRRVRHGLPVIGYDVILVVFISRDVTGFLAQVVTSSSIFKWCFHEYVIMRSST